MLKVVVIGNAPNLIGKNLGKKIDQFAKIVRFNDFRTKGYEKDLGSRTTHWGASVFAVYQIVQRHQMPCDANLGGIEELWTQEHYFDSNGNIAKFVMDYAGLTVDNVRMYTKRTWDNYAKSFGTTPSNGFMGVITALEVFKGRDIYIAGFGNGDGHYYDLEHQKGGHNLPAESAEYNKMIHDGKLHVLGAYE